MIDLLCGGKTKRISVDDLTAIVHCDAAIAWDRDVSPMICDQKVPFLFKMPNGGGSYRVWINRMPYPALDNDFGKGFCGMAFDWSLSGNTGAWVRSVDQFGSTARGTLRPGTGTNHPV